MLVPEFDVIQFVCVIKSFGKLLQFEQNASEIIP